jgi:hypothetical protein
MAGFAARGSGALQATTIAAAAALLALAALLATLAAVITGAPCTPTITDAAPTHTAHDAIPRDYLTLYKQAGRDFGIPWPVLAAVGAIETDHGRSRAPGVQSGVNAFGCCAGPMQFNISNGPPSTWDGYGRDANHDGRRDVYDPEDAIPAAARYLRALLELAHGDLRQAILGYNHSGAYADDVLARAKTYANAPPQQLATLPAGSASNCSAARDTAAAGPANVKVAERATAPKAFRALPDWASAPGHPPQVIDARLYDDVTWILRRYGLRVTAAREAGHHTHGDGTAVDLIPARGSSQPIWDATAGRLAHDLGWNPACARSGSRPACPLAPAIQFVGYDGYPQHGSPRTCASGCPAHLHLSWASPCFGSSALTPACTWVLTFPLGLPVA